MKTKNNNKPMLFSTPMVQAIVDNSKSITRREVKATTPEMIAIMVNIYAGCDVELNKSYLMRHSRLEKGNVIWVREAWNYSDDVHYPYLYRQIITEDYAPQYQNMHSWKPSIHMPKEAARLFLKVKDVKIELLQDITEGDAKKEGVKEFLAGYENYLWVPDEHHIDYENHIFRNAVDSFRSLWCKINGLESWITNPLVWVIEFEKVEKPKDF